MTEPTPTPWETSRHLADRQGVSPQTILNRAASGDVYDGCRYEQRDVGPDDDVHPLTKQVYRAVPVETLADSIDVDALLEELPPPSTETERRLVELVRDLQAELAAIDVESSGELGEGLVEAPDALIFWGRERVVDVDALREEINSLSMDLRVARQERDGLKEEIAKVESGALKAIRQREATSDNLRTTIDRLSLERDDLQAELAAIDVESDSSAAVVETAAVDDLSEQYYNDGCLDGAAPWVDFAWDIAQGAFGLEAIVTESLTRLRKHYRGR